MMRDPAQQVEQYLRKALHMDVVTHAWIGSARLPPFLKTQYRFAEIRILGRQFILMVDSEKAEQSPATIRKHIELVRKKGDAPIVYVRPHVTAYNRKRLIEQGVPFIIPGNQMYLPTLGLDLREHFRALHTERPKFSPATQVLVIHAILRETSQVLIPGEMARRFEYSPMTMTRAFNELEKANLGNIAVHGRERCLEFLEDRRTLWARAVPLMRSPIFKRVFIQRTPMEALAFRAGLAALANYSMLAHPAHDTWAMSREDWSSLRKRQHIMEVPTPDSNDLEIEVWRYAPGLLASKDRVDPLSLYLSLKETHDERVESALDQMMEALPW